MKKDAGFTFIETLIVLAIILILSASIGLSGVKYIEKARHSAAVSEIAMYSNALYTYYLDCGVFPTKTQGLKALWVKPVFHPIPHNWQGPYINKEPGLDPWGREYIYSDDNDMGLPFSLMSTGRTMVDFEGGEDDNVYSWK